MQGIEIDVFDRLKMVVVLAVHATTCGGLPHIDPVGGAIAGATEAGRGFPTAVDDIRNGSANRAGLWCKTRELV